MLSKITSGAVSGVEGYIVEVETDVSQGLPGFDIVGLPDSAVRESRERVRTAIKNSGMMFPVKRITVNLAPADTKKEGPSYDLPIAVGILVCMGVCSTEQTVDTFFAGELSLDGTIRPVSGILPMVYGAFSEGITRCVVPYENAGEAALVEGISVYGVKSLGELINHLMVRPMERTVISREGANGEKSPSADLDFADVRGQENVKRVLMLAAAGGHNVLMIGSPGSGKTMMARRFPTILPDLSFEESIEVTKIYSVAGLIGNKNSLMVKRPFRAPHHTVSYAGLTGGGRSPRPGEISLAHNGVLFLDELPEFHRNVLEVLRQPMEDGSVTISRVGGTIIYPADFMLVTAMNPCPCGSLGIPDKCNCTQNEIGKYLNKISEPLLDRIDLHVEASPVQYADLNHTKKTEPSAAIKKRVIAARLVQTQRYAHENNRVRSNARLSTSQIEKYCRLGEPERELLKRAFDALHLSARAYHKILKVARTIADIEGAADIQAEHLAEAIQYRSLDRRNGL